MYGSNVLIHVQIDQKLFSVIHVMYWELSRSNKSRS